MANTYTAEVKAQVIADWKTGASLGQLVKAHGVPKTTVRAWVEGMDRTGTVLKKNTPTLDEMAWELVGESFAALRAILRKAQDDSWLDKQNANDIAIFFGVTSDKLLRLLAAGAKQDELRSLPPADA